MHEESNCQICRHERQDAEFFDRALSNLASAVARSGTIDLVLDEVRRCERTAMGFAALSPERAEDWSAWREAEAALESAGHRAGGGS